MEMYSEKEKHCFFQNIRDRVINKVSWIFFNVETFVTIYWFKDENNAQKNDMTFIIKVGYAYSILLEFILPTYASQITTILDISNLTDFNPIATHNSLE